VRKRLGSSPSRGTIQEEVLGFDPHDEHSKEITMYQRPPVKMEIRVAGDGQNSIFVEPVTQEDYDDLKKRVEELEKELDFTQDRLRALENY
jgi:hypothetical protein